MNVLVLNKLPSNEPFHDVAVLKHVASSYDSTGPVNLGGDGDICVAVALDPSIANPRLLKTEEALFGVRVHRLPASAGDALALAATPVIFSPASLLGIADPEAVAGSHRVTAQLAGLAVNGRPNVDLTACLPARLSPAAIAGLVVRAKQPGANFALHDPYRTKFRDKSRVSVFDLQK